MAHFKARSTRKGVLKLRAVSLVWLKGLLLKTTSAKNDLITVARRTDGGDAQNCFLFRSST